MNVKFHLNKKEQPDSEDGVKVVYGNAKRGGYRLRWYIILAIVISPVAFMAYYLFKDSIWITAPGVVTSYPVTVTANFDGVVGPIDLHIGDEVKEHQMLFTLGNSTLNEEVNFLENELKHLDINQTANFDTYENAISYSKENLKQIDYIKHRYELYRAEGQVSDADYASILNQSSSAQNALSSQQIQLDQSRYAYKESLVAGVVAQAKRALQKELVQKLDQQASLTVKAPYKGRVVDIKATEGTRVLKGDPLVTIAKNVKPSVIAYLDPKYLEEATLGKKVRVSFPDGETYHATVSQEIQIVSQLPTPLVKPFEGQPSFLKVGLTIDDDLTEVHWIEGITVEVTF